MNTETKETRKISFREPSVGYLRDFILDKEISDADSIALDELMFDEIALDFRKVYNEPISMPFIFLGVWVKSVNYETGSYNTAIITFDDPIPDDELTMDEIISRQKKGTRIYRCGYCESLIDEFGDPLLGDLYDESKQKLRIHKKHFPVSVGKCCERRQY